ncbi:MAG TPA: histidine kinase [Terriglobia bacterium]|jgi:signal transduction histidine kinase
MKRIIFLKPFFWPRISTLRELPLALLQIAIYGALSGPIVGYFFIWLMRPPGIWHVTLPPGAFVGWLVYASRSAILYVGIYYLTLGVSIDYSRRRYQPRGLKLGLLYGAGWVVALFLTAWITPGTEQFRQKFLAMFDGDSLRVVVVMTILFALIRLFRSRLEKARAEKAAAEALSQVKALQAQINPHFFFNTLNTIYALIPVDPPAAQRTVALLADMSRHAFATAQADLIPLAQELDFVKAYLEIEKVRFGQRLQCEMPGTETAAGIHVPALIVQPLIENAIRHGISRRMDGGKVAVEIDRKGDSFSVTVRNQCDASPERSALSFFREGHALENIRERLRIHYRDKALLTISFPSVDAVAVTITGPLQ